MTLRMVDRLEELQRKRQYVHIQEESHDGDDMPLENSSFTEQNFSTEYRQQQFSDSQPSQSTKMQTFFSIVDDTRHCITEITFRNEEIRQVQERILSKPPGAHQADKEKHLELIEEVKRYTVRVHKGLKKIEDEIKADERSGLDGKSVAEFRIKKSQYTSLALQVKQAMTEFRRLEEDHREKNRNIIKRQLQAMHPEKSVSDDQVEYALDEESFSILSMDDHRRLVLDEVNARRKEIEELEQNIQELNEMFLNMLFLIDEQGEMIDHIEHNVSTALDFVDKGEQALKVSVAQRRENRRLKFIICLILTFVIVFVIVVLVVGGAVAASYLSNPAKEIVPTVAPPSGPDITRPSTITRPNFPTDVLPTNSALFG